MADLNLVRTGRVAELRLQRNSLNSLSPGFVVEIASSLRELGADDSVGALVLSSSAPRFFSAGWDLPELLQLPEEDFRSFYQGFVSMSLGLATLGKPTVAAIGGFAVAGGAILALCCDFRLMSSGGAKLGLNEVDLGMPMPLPAVLLARQVAGWRGARDLLVAGRLFTPAEAAEAGLVDEVVDPERVIDGARALAESLAAKPEGAAALMKGLLHAELLTACQADRAEDEARMVEAFFRPATRRLLETAAAKLVPR